MRQCSACGCELKEGENYCPACGAEAKEKQEHHKSVALSVLIFLMIVLILYGECRKYSFSVHDLILNWDYIAQELIESLSL